jgi:hypothetical protein
LTEQENYRVKQGGILKSPMAIVKQIKANKMFLGDDFSPIIDEKPNQSLTQVKTKVNEFQ